MGTKTEIEAPDSCTLHSYSWVRINVSFPRIGKVRHFPSVGSVYLTHHNTHTHTPLFAAHDWCVLHKHSVLQKVHMNQNQLVLYSTDRHHKHETDL